MYITILVKQSYWYISQVSGELVLWFIYLFIYLLFFATALHTSILFSCSCFDHYIELKNEHSVQNISQ